MKSRYFFSNTLHLGFGCNLVCLSACLSGLSGCLAVFYSILFYSILFYSILFYSILFYSIPFHSILFHSIPFHSILFHSIPFYSIPFYSIIFHSILFYSIPFHSIVFYSIPFYSIPFYSIRFYSVLQWVLFLLLQTIPKVLEGEPTEAGRLQINFRKNRFAAILPCTRLPGSLHSFVCMCLFRFCWAVVTKKLKTEITAIVHC